jgi:tRNA(fMet)-specific endonuclease VapC
VLPITDQIIVRAADIYADLHVHGQLIPDADILIAATALDHGLVMATSNVADFGRISGLRIDNWLV